MSDTPAVEAKPNLRIRTTVDIPQDDGDLIQLELEQTNGSSFRGRITSNGKSYTMFKMSSDVLATDYFLATPVLELAAAFDQVSAISNSIDGDWLVEHLIERFNERAVDDPAVLESIKRLVVVPHLMGLFSIGNPVMSELYGHNWVVEQSATLIKQSKAWKALVSSVTLAQDGLANALPS